MTSTVVSVQLSFPAMATQFNLEWSAGTIAGDVRECELQKRVEQLEGRLSRFIADSPVSTLETSWQKLDEDTLGVLRAAQSWSEITRGFFRPFPTLKSGSATLEFQGNNARIAGDYQPGSLDLGGIAKGYTAQCLVNILRDAGAPEILVSCGGSSITSFGRSARIRLQSPWAGAVFFGEMEISSESLSFSAVGQTEVSSRLQLSHVMGRGGEPALTDICAAVVVGEDAMGCEALSTALLAGGTPLLRELSDGECRVLTRDYRAAVFTTNGKVYADPSLALASYASLPQASRLV